MSPGLRRLVGRGGGGPITLSLPLDRLELARRGPAPLAAGAAQAAGNERLHVAILLVQFRRGSGGHAAIGRLVQGLEALGHRVTLWLQDDEGRHAGESREETEALFRSFFGEMAAPLHTSPAGWEGADVVLATGWQTVARALLAPGARARAYLVQDHEPEFYPTSAERLWAEATYREGLHCICSSDWLAELVTERYGASASAFSYGVDPDRYHALPTHRRDDLVLFYARAVTARRAVPLGLLALAELHARRPGAEIALFGESREVTTPFPHRHLGVLEEDGLAHAYASATVGICLSLTNPSLIPAEMMACGLPVVDIASDSMLRTFGADGPVEPCAPDPLALCAGIERLLDDLVLRAERSRAGSELATGRTWAAAAAQVEEGLREALRRAAA